jgi:dTDP-4-dehydrorhamnose 3,5-epimerase
MRFEGSQIEGLFRIEVEPREDERGWFARLTCPNEFAAAGINFTPRQTSLSHNRQHLTLRGLHWCAEDETKIVRCTRGRIFDVAVDLRKGSSSYCKWIGVELSAINATALLIPTGVAHGFLSLEDDSDVLYAIDRIYRSGFDRGVRWNDPAFAIAWPATPAIINSRDAQYPDYLGDT